MKYSNILSGILFFGFLLLSSFIYAQNVGIGTNTPDNTARLEVADTSRGVLFPRLTQNQRNNITSPATGLTIYQTDNTPGYYYYNGTKWVRLNTGASGDNDWVRDADTLYSAPDSTVTVKGGNVGIGTTTPQYQLHLTKSLTVEQKYPKIRLNVTQSGGNGILKFMENGNLRYRIGYNETQTEWDFRGGNTNGSGNTGTIWDVQDGTDDVRFFGGIATDTMPAPTDGILTSGPVGIGTTTPQSKLHIAPNNAAAQQIDPYGTSAGQTGEARFLELSTNGTNYVAVKAPDTLSNNVVIILPESSGSSNQVLTTDGTGKTQWQDVKSVTTQSHCFTCDGF